MKLLFLISFIFFNASTTSFSSDTHDGISPANYRGNFAPAASSSQSTHPPINQAPVQQQSRFSTLLDEAFASGKVSKELTDLIRLSAQETLRRAMSRGSSD